MSYLLSAKIDVFPTTRRTFQSARSRLFTEHSVTGIVRGLVDGEGFVSSALRENYLGSDSFIFNIHGYYFQTQLGELTQLGFTDVYATITLDTTNTFIELQGQDEDNRYKGVEFTGTAQTGANKYSLQLLHYNGSTWEVPATSLYKFSLDSLDITLIDGGEI